MKVTDLNKKVCDLEVTNIRYYNLKTELTNVYDVCILLDKNNKILSRGVSICSFLDQYVKKTGRNRAFGRAVKALVNKQNSLEINPLRFENEIVELKFKAKNNEQDIKIKKRLKNIKTTKKVNGSIIEYKCKIPYSYPIVETYISFKYKSEFLPLEKTKIEKSIIEKLEFKNNKEK